MGEPTLIDGNFGFILVKKLKNISSLGQKQFLGK